MQLIDSHCHFDSPAFDADRDRVYQAAVNRRVTHIISPAITASSWQNLSQICLQYPRVHPAFGLHPMFMPHHQRSDLQRLEQQLQNHLAVALGECGLDFYQGKADAAEQLYLFEQQLILANHFDLPVIVHARKAVEPALQAIRRKQPLRGVMHSFSGSLEQARQAVDLGFFLGFGGPLTWPRSTRLQRVVKALPLQALLLETDAPDQPDAAHRGQRNEPAWLGNTVQFIATLKDVEPAEVAAITSENARSLFSLNS